MRDGQQCSISLIRSHSEGGILLYELQILHKGTNYLISLRYSVLRAVAKMLPNCDVKFPQPHHLSSFITNLTGNGEFLERRYKDLTLYFEAINKITELENSLGIKIMLFGKTSDFPMVDLSMIPPMAPRIKGKKLVAKIVEAQIC